MAKKYIIEIDEGEWSIRREDFSFSKIHDFKNFDKKPPDLSFGQFRFLDKQVIYLLDIGDCNKKDVKTLEEFTCFNIAYEFIAFNYDTKEELSKFEGTFIDAFNYINKNKGIMGYE